MAEEGTDELMSKLDALDLTMEESSLLDPVSHEDATVGLQYAVVAKVLTRRPVSQRALISVMGKVWGTAKTMKCNDLGDDMILINFSSERDRRYVLQGGPWNFNDRPIIFAEYDGLTRPSELDFRWLVLWVRVYDLPICFMNKNMAGKIGGMFGEVLDTDTNGEGFGWGEYLRFCVRMDVTKPLRRGVLIKTVSNPDGEWFEAKYEKIPHFCFFCGRVGFETCDCADRSMKEGLKRKYNEELRATGGRRGYNVNQGEGWRKERVHEGSFSTNHHNSGSRNTSPVKGSGVGDGRSAENQQRSGREGEELSNLKEGASPIEIDEEGTELEKDGSMPERSDVAQTSRKGKGRGRPRNSQEKNNLKASKLVGVVGESNEGRKGASRGEAEDADGRVAWKGKELVLAMDVETSVMKEGMGSDFFLSDVRSMEKGGGKGEAGGKRKRSVGIVGVPLAITMGDNAEGTEEEVTGPKQRRKKEVSLMSLSKRNEVVSAKAASGQPRRSQ